MSNLGQLNNEMFLASKDQAATKLLKNSSKLNQAR